MTLPQTMPALFVGHGNPMNALERNATTERWAAIGKALPKPRAIVSVSAHWYVPGTAVTAMKVPRTIHDFGGFPPELFQVAYPAPGDPTLARRVQSLLGPVPVALDQDWGLDHGTWSVLCHLFPQADVPVVQLSIDETLSPKAHHELGKKLAPLREEGVLILGSGNVVHNLHAYSWGRRPVQPFDWAVRFESAVRKLISSGDPEPLIDWESLGTDARLSVPTPDHYLPLLYVVAQRRKSEAVSYPVEGFDGGSISMLSVQIG